MRRQFHTLLDLFMVWYFHTFFLGCNGRMQTNFWTRYGLSFNQIWRLENDKVTEY